MIYLKELNVEQFRGISNLKIKDLGNVNLIVGDNNSGKTSVLEAIMALRNVKEIANILSVVRLRDSKFMSPFRLSLFDSFLYTFNPSHEKMKLSVSGILNSQKIGMVLVGTMENVMIDTTEIYQHSGYQEKESDLTEKETSEFQGELTSVIGNETTKKYVAFNPYTRVTGVRIPSSSVIDINYVSPTEHTSGSVFNRIVKENDYKQIVLKVIQIFDRNIEDLLYIRNDETGRPIECLKHKDLGVMPLVTFGDGIKKVLLLSNSIANAANGILLIDEVETAIHSKYYDDIFKFIIKACMEFNIQIFATTHSIEAVDGFLKTQVDPETDNYVVQNDDLIRLITFRKNVEKNCTDARVLKGEDVYHNRTNFDFEVRL